MTSDELACNVELIISNKSEQRLPRIVCLQLVNRFINVENIRKGASYNSLIDVWEGEYVNFMWC